MSPTLFPALCTPLHRLWAEGGVVPALRRFLSGGPQAPANEAQAHRGRAGSAAAGRGSARGKGAAPGFEDEVLFAVFSSNLAGIVCARSIHYQFYSW